MLGDDIPEAHKALIRAGWSPPKALRTPELLRWLIADQTNVDTAGCWLWGGPTRNSYGYLWGHGTHRLAYEAWREPIPKGMHLDHLCRKRACCNPAHLEVVTPAENNRRAIAYVQRFPDEPVHHGAKRWCKRGHPFDQANTRWDKAGKRYCRTCGNDHTRKLRAGTQKPRGRQWHIDEALWAELRPAHPDGQTMTRREMAELCGVTGQVLENWFCNHPSLIVPVNPGRRPLRYYRSEVLVLVQCRTDTSWARSGPNFVKSSYVTPKARRSSAQGSNAAGIRASA